MVIWSTANIPSHSSLQIERLAMTAIIITLWVAAIVVGLATAYTLRLAWKAGD